MHRARGQTQAVTQDCPVQPASRVAAAPVRHLGNQAILRRLASIAPRVQSKLTVGPVNDPLEREADSVADQVMRMPESSATVQRKCAACQEEDEKLMRKESAAVPTGSVGAPPSVQAVLGSPGRPLEAAVRSGFEAKFGQDFSRVRIHEDRAAADSARDVGALAYTVGPHVAFARGQYSPGSREGQRLLAHELAHVVQQTSTGDRVVARQTPPPPVAADPPVDAGAPTDAGAPVVAAPPAVAPPAAAGPAPTGCAALNCTDAKFTALDPAGRAAQFAAQCPTGYPLDTTFFGQPIPAASNAKLKAKLLQSAADAKKAMCLNGQDPNAYQLDRKIITYDTHKPTMERAVDIDVLGQPYIMHEAGEADVDASTGPVFDRIAYWSHYRKSIIPKGITTVDPVKGDPTARTWTDPNTGTKDTPTTTGELYDKLKGESDDMKAYFNLLLKTDDQLKRELEIFVSIDFAGENSNGRLKFGLPKDSTDADVKAFRQRIADDYMLMGGSKAQLKAFAGKDIAKQAKNAPGLAGEKEDRPFAGGMPEGSTTGTGKSTAPDPAANRRPELGFISLPKEVVVALTANGLAWGAIDFHGASGDMMHFDCRLGAC